MAQTFGKYLLEHGIVGRQALEEATQVMVVFGGRLGTILVEAGHLTIEEVEAHLGAYLDRPCAPEDRLANPDLEALELFPADMARRYSAFPMWIEKRTLHVAMLDTQDPDCIDHMAFETGLGIAPYVVAERRLVELLDRYYGIRPDSRFTDPRILEMAGHCHPARRRTQEPEPEAAPSAAEETDEARERATLGIEPLEDDEELAVPVEYFEFDDGEDEGTAAAPLPAAESTESPDGRPVEPLQHPAAPRLVRARDSSELAQLEADLVLLADRDEIATIALRMATYLARSAALFAVRDGMIQGVQAAGDVKTPEIDGLYLPVESDSMLSRAARERKIVRGQPPSEGIDANIMRHLRVEPPKESAVLPVCIDRRVVNLLYVDNDGLHLSESALAGLEVLCESIGTTYTRLILMNTQRHC
jgi:hypothetical protein